MNRASIRLLGICAGALAAGLLLRDFGPRPALLLAVAQHPQQVTNGEGADAVALAICGAAAWLVLSWLAFGLLLAAVAHAPGVIGRIAGQVAEVALPAALYRVLMVSVGLSLATGTGIATASAAAVPSVAMPVGASSLPQSGSGESAGHARTDTGDLDWPTAHPTARRPPATRSTRSLVVAPGDSLWRIAATQLPAGADNAQIAAAWPRWYAANRAVVGDDPSLIRPGQHLHAPTSRRTR